MPNHIKNRLTFSGDKSKINELVARFSTFHPAKQRTSFDGELTFEKEGNCGWLATDGSFSYRENGKMKTAPKILDGYTPSMEPEWTRFPDFNKVIEMPDGLADTVSDGLIGYIETRFSSHQKMSEFLEKINSQSLSAVENLAKGIVNLKKHGHATWYGWSCEHWGTKWNSYSCEKRDENIWEFDTAWSGVPKILSEIAKAFPEIEIVYEYSDEDTGSNCGIYVFENGSEAKKTIFESQSTEAYELAFKLRPGYAKNYALVDGKYEYKEEEEE